MEDLKHSLASRLWSTLEVHLIELIFHQTGPVSMAPSFQKTSKERDQTEWDSMRFHWRCWTQMKKCMWPGYLEDFPANCICRTARAWIIWWIGVMWSGAGKMSSVLLIDFSLLPWHFFANHRGVGRMCIRGGHYMGSRLSGERGIGWCTLRSGMPQLLQLFFGGGKFPASGQEMPGNKNRFRRLWLEPSVQCQLKHPSLHCTHL